MSTKKTEYIVARISPSEKERLRKQASEVRMSMSEYLLALSRKKRIIRVDGVPELTVEITRIGVNINQIATIANARKNISEAQLAAVLNNLEDIKNLMASFLKEFYSIDEDIKV